MTSTPETAVTTAGEFASRWPLTAVIVVQTLIIGGLFYFRIFEAAKNEEAIISQSGKVQDHALGQSDKVLDHVILQNNKMTALLERCVVPDSELLKLRQDP